MHHNYFSNPGSQVPSEHHSAEEVPFSSTQPGAYCINHDPAADQRESSSPLQRDLFSRVLFGEKMLETSRVRIDVDNNGLVQRESLLYCRS